MPLESIKNREGDVVYFDRTRIERALEKAAEAINYRDLSFVEPVTDCVVKKLLKISAQEEKFITIEEIQDIVEQELMKADIFPVLKEYILYRNEQNQARSKQRQKIEKKLEKHTLKIVKTDGSKEKFNIAKVKKTYKRVNYQLARKCKFEDLEDSLKKYIVE
jgi:anaerobic ribonucleoside-triphosphate reductase